MRAVRRAAFASRACAAHGRRSLPFPTAGRRSDKAPDGSVKSRCLVEELQPGGLAVLTWEALDGLVAIQARALPESARRQTALLALITRPRRAWRLARHGATHAPPPVTAVRRPGHPQRAQRAI